MEEHKSSETLLYHNKILIILLALALFTVIIVSTLFFLSLDKTPKEESQTQPNLIINLPSTTDHTENNPITQNTKDTVNEEVAKSDNSEECKNVFTTCYTYFYDKIEELNTVGEQVSGQNMSYTQSVESYNLYSSKFNELSAIMNECKPKIKDCEEILETEGYGASQFLANMNTIYSTLKPQIDDWLQSLLQQH